MRRYDSLMGGAEIEATFGNSEVSAIEKRVTELEAALQETQTALNTTTDEDERETLETQAAEQREALRAALAELRTIQKKYPQLGGDKKKAA